MKQWNSRLFLRPQECEQVLQFSGQLPAALARALDRAA